MAKDKEYYSKKEQINLQDFMLLNITDQDLKVSDILKKMYEDEEKFEQKHVEKVTNIAFDSQDNIVYLPGNLCAEKQGGILYFYFKKRRTVFLILLFLLLGIGLAGAGTYVGILYLTNLNLNIDVDGDGIPDINIDLDGDRICDVNCDTDNDGIPDTNLDYQGNRKGIFNQLTEEDGKPVTKNPINQDIDGDGKCDINCDTDGDGWPDKNIDYDGDGTVDLDKDTDDDGIKDVNLDLNGDGVCDLNCDDDNDGVCDRNCTNVKIKDNGNGTSSQTGDNAFDILSATLVVVFENASEIKVAMLYPDDQNDPNVNTKVPDLKFTVKNTSDAVQYYNILWQDIFNDYESNNFWFKVISDNNGYQTGTWQNTPITDGMMASKVAIAPKTTQSYVISFTLHGTGEEQNYDQGKTFKGKVAVDIIENNKEGE